MTIPDENIQKARDILDAHLTAGGPSAGCGPEMLVSLRTLLTPKPKTHTFAGVTFVDSGRYTPAVGEWGLVDGVPSLREPPATDPYPSGCWLNVPILSPVPDPRIQRYEEALRKIRDLDKSGWIDSPLHTTEAIAREALGGDDAS